jgi:hypothetical protein
MISQVVSGVAGPLFKLVDNLFTSDEERDKAKLQLLKMEQDGKLESVKQEMSVLLAEAKSKDPWTSRARPSFLYVFYTLILFGIPVGITSIFNPEAAIAMGNGFKGWLDAIPEEAWTAFWICFSGYTGARTFEKHKGVTK